MNNENFYHILIIRSKILGDLVIKAFKQEDMKYLNNFAILCMNNKMEICGRNFVETILPAEPKKCNYSSDSYFSSNSKSSKFSNHFPEENELVTISQFKSFMNEFVNSLNNMKNSIENLTKKIESIIKK